ncbi:Protein of Unknown function [Blastococcus fimeti]|nr:Protein of Unknown function [Blastococcus fimeti]
MLLAHTVAVLHATAVLFMLAGALVAVRRPRLVLLHAPVALAILAVNLAGADCPLTDLELALREHAGAPAYEGGFLGHYVFAPLGLDVRAAGVQLGVYAVALVLNAVGYGLLVHTMSATRRSARGPGRRRRAPRRRTPARPAAARPAGPRTSSRTSALARR